MSVQRFGTTERYSDIVVHNGTLYTVEVPTSIDTNIETQTSEVLGSIDRLLTEAGSDKSRILMATIYLTDMDDYEGMNAVWDSWLPKGAAPCRVCVQVAALANEGWRVEIALTAAVD
ncbi:RidA family protein [Nitrogeniibacter mangrovi]|uniref:RidA family protein n=1 Tax=Nitrogeniibacter mangrovi TaxID=2016596 RepID=A0A6C1AYN8_9RHOO|nr:RidA family protein [Nitrogeniibacter mangrovi]QID16482.1 RidA family protein [Nitrogeniibacter mangrovi]